jgi:hypothetical protein
MPSAENGGRRKVAPPVTRGTADRPPLPPATAVPVSRARWDHLSPVSSGDVGGPPHDCHVRLTERHCVAFLRSVGWVFVAGTPSKAPELIRPRRLDHHGGC